MLAGSGLPDAASWWALPGRAGWQPGAEAGLGFPATYAGLLRGGWRLDEPLRAAAGLPWPGVVQARSPLAWYDSLSCADGGDAGAGWDAALTEAVGEPPLGWQRARSAFGMMNGSSGLDEASVTLARSDSARGIGVDAMSGTHGAREGVERSGRHAWGARLHLVRGSHLFSGSMGQRGSAAKLDGGEEQTARGQSGSADWRWERGNAYWVAGFERALDRHESFGGRLASSERVAQETRLKTGFGLVRGARELQARLVCSQAEVRRAGARSFSRQAGSCWASLRGTAPAAGGQLVLTVGAGRHGGVKRFDVAPSAEFARRVRGFETDLRVERLLTPVWTDLAAGVEPFMQRAWVGSAKATTAGSGTWRMRAETRGGRVYSRALADRRPLEEIWLRSGLSAEYGTYDFALAETGIERRGRSFDAGLEGFALAHRSTAPPPGVERAVRADPDAGCRAWLGARGRLFRGDLGLGLRVEAAGVGSRECDLAQTPRLPAFVTFTLVGEASIGDAVIVWRVRNLEDHAREESWTDGATGLPAITGRREVCLSVVWRLFN